MAAFHQLVVRHNPVSLMYHVCRVLIPAAESARKLDGSLPLAAEWGHNSKASTKAFAIRRLRLTQRLRERNRRASVTLELYPP
ncbi:hypothetical protein SBA3_1690011 [Candidatus Sulfopaludibacter sp. SbA3]|nr:hypothetical protein SBA3_1690011 [Candidatus Sulfopaludibacter sp. SbA3]